MATGDKVVNLNDLKAVKDYEDGEIDALKSAFDDLYDETIGITRTPVELTANYRTSTTASGYGSPASSNGYQTAVVDCSPGDVFEVLADTQSTSYNTYAFYLTSGNRGTYATTLSGKTKITAPANAVKVVFNNRSTYCASPSIVKLVQTNPDSIEKRIDSVESIVNKNANHIAFLRRGLYYDTVNKLITVYAQQMLYDGARKTIDLKYVDVSGQSNYFALIYNSQTEEFSAVNTDFTLSSVQYLVGAFDARVPEMAFVFGKYVVDGFHEDYGLNHMTDEGLENIASDWWIYPVATRYKVIRDKIYTGYIDCNGVSGVIAIDKVTGDVQRRNLYKSDTADEHNSPSVTVMADGKIMVICTNHGKTPYHMIYISEKPESIASFKKYSIKSEYDAVTYAQVVQMGSTYYLFYRTHTFAEGSTSTAEYHWSYRTSTDGATWSAEKTWLTGGTVQYYMLARQYDSTHIKIYMQSNASLGETDIRLCYFDIENEKILDTDMTTVIADLTTLSDPISYDTFTVILAKTSTYKNRLLSVAPGTDLSFTCGRIQSADSYAVYIYRYVNGSFTANTIPNMGGSFGYGSNSTYINHAEIVDVDNGTYTIVYAAQTASGWELRKITVTDTAGTPVVISETDSTSNKLIRPFKVIGDDAVIATRGTWTNYTAYYEDFIIVDTD